MYPAKQPSSIIPSALPSVMPIVPMTRSKMAHIIENGKSLFKDAPSTTTGVIKAHTPITTMRLNMFEPVTLLTASVLLCAMDAATLTAVSGSIFKADEK